MHNPDRRLLHVDDDPAIQRLVARLLQPRGIQVTSLADPTQTLDRLHSENYRVVLMDIEMPQASGLDVLRQIKKYDGGIQVIMLTAMVTQTTVLRSHRWGAEACLFKPISDPEMLVQAVESAYDKIDRWWEILAESNQRKAGDGTATPATIAR